MAFHFNPRIYVHPDRIGSLKTEKNRLLVVHTSEGSEGDNSAEQLCAFMGLPGDRISDSGRRYGSSYHYVPDTDGGVFPAVRDDTWAFAAAGANNFAVQFCIPGKAGQTREQWLDPVSLACIQSMAWAMRLKATQFNIPLKRLTAAQVAAGASGYCGHVDVSNAFHQSDHTDPGVNFPWDILAQLLTDPTGAPSMATFRVAPRLLDTRVHPSWGRKVAAGEIVTLVVDGNRPAWAQAAIINLTAVGADGPGFLVVWDGLGPKPTTSNLNYSAGPQAVANLAHVPLNGNTFVVQASQATHLIVDHQGWDQLI